MNREAPANAGASRSSWSMTDGARLAAERLGSDDRRMTETSGRARIPRWIASIVLVIALIVSFVGVYWFFTQGPGLQILSPAGSTVAAFGGEGDQTTATFQVREGWGIQWESKGTQFAFAIQGDRDFGKVIDINEPGSGVTSPTGAGSFHLEVTAKGPWTISITQGN